MCPVKSTSPVRAFPVGLNRKRFNPTGNRCSHGIVTLASIERLCLATVDIVRSQSKFIKASESGH
jgi:hypothetical protein